MITLPRRWYVSRMTLASGAPSSSGFVHAIAVGGFHEQHVGFGHRRGIGQHRTAVAAKIAAEQQGLARLLDAHARVRRSQQMAGVQELHGDARRHGNRPLVADGLEQRHRAVGIFRREQRQRRLMAGVALAVRAFRVFFLNLGRVGEHDLREVRGGRAYRRCVRETPGPPAAAGSRNDPDARASGSRRASPASASATDASSARAVP